MANVSIKTSSKFNEEEILKIINDIVYSNITKLGGSISAEHGIGQLKKRFKKILKASLN